MGDDEIIHLDPMEIEVDEYNVRYDSPIDEQVIKQIYQDLKRGKGIEYHITVREKNGKYYCYIGRNRLLAAKKYVEETGNRIKIPVKIKNVDDLEAMNLSLQENLKRKDLTPTETSRALRKMYEMWIERKKAEILQMSKNEAVHGEQLLKEQYHPYDPTNPFSISKFIQENNIPLRRIEVLRLLVLDRLPDWTKRWIDNGYIDTYTAYELSKFDDKETIIRYTNILLNFRNVSRDIKVGAISKVRKEGGDFYEEIFKRYRKHLINKYPVFQQLSDDLISYMAKEVPGQKLPRLAEKLEALVGIGLRLDDIDNDIFSGIVDMDRISLNKFIEFCNNLTQRYQKVDINFLLGEYIQTKDTKALEMKLRKVEIGVQGGRLRKMEEEIEELAETASTHIQRLITFLRTDLGDILGELESALAESAFDRRHLKMVLNSLYDYMFYSPGYAPKERDVKRRTVPGILFRLLGHEYVIAERLVMLGLKYMDLGEVRSGAEKLTVLVGRLMEMIDAEFHAKLASELERIGSDLKNVDVGDAKRVGEYVSFISGVESLLEMYLNMRYYISLMNTEMRNVMANEVNRLMLLYKGSIRKIGECRKGGEFSASPFKEYVDNMATNDLYLHVERYLDLRDEVWRLLDEVRCDIDDLGVHELRARFHIFRERYDECVSKFDPRCLEILRESLNKFIDEYTERYGEELGRVVDVEVSGLRVKAMVTPSGAGLTLKLLNDRVVDEVDATLKYGGSEYDIRISRETRLSISGVKKREDSS